MAYLTRVLRAIKPEVNTNRFYTIDVSRGLFESWVVMIAYGRYNGRGQQKNYVFYALEEVIPFIKKRMHKRLTAEKRIGCNYTIVHQHGPEDLIDGITR